ncbi:uncharacterized protein [Nicotiana tomentosiformis]|uniref:uncharacterized protein n=1 Tax=Nicotiana tomentosiformis TaxID=4098 RepID=UPI00388C63E5
MPWMAVGDFNSVLNMEDRIGENPVSLIEVVEFSNCIKACGLLELPHQGNKYTWNDRRSEQRIYSKIDWVVINEEWLDNMPLCKAKFLTKGISDHCPVKIVLAEEKQRSSKSFKFCNVWAQHLQFLEVIRRKWDTQMEGYQMMQVVKKLKLLKKDLRLLNVAYFKNIETEAKEDREALQTIQEKLQLNPGIP